VARDVLSSDEDALAPARDYLSAADLFRFEMLLVVQLPFMSSETNTFARADYSAITIPLLAHIANFIRSVMASIILVRASNRSVMI
jgi:hypothetical protein